MFLLSANNLTLDYHWFFFPEFLLVVEELRRNRRVQFLDMDFDSINLYSVLFFFSVENWNTKKVFQYLAKLNEFNTRHKILILPCCLMQRKPTI